MENTVEYNYEKLWGYTYTHGLFPLVIFVSLKVGSITTRYWYLFQKDFFETHFASTVESKKYSDSVGSYCNISLSKVLKAKLRVSLAEAIYTPSKYGWAFIKINRDSYKRAVSSYFQSSKL